MNVCSVVIFTSYGFVMAMTVVHGCVVYSGTVDGRLSFANDVSSVEIVSSGAAERLDCAAVNFCNITWYMYKDGIPFLLSPPEEASNFYLDDKGQFLNFKRADSSDKGFYECVVSDGAEKITRTVQLVVLENTHNTSPKLLGDEGGACADQFAETGQTVTFTCEFYVGKDGIRPHTAGWLKVMPETGEVMPVEALDSTEIQIRTKQIRRNDSVIIAHLQILNIGEEAFGAWKVYANNGYQTEYQLNVKRKRPSTAVTPSNAPADSHNVSSCGCDGSAATIRFLICLLASISALLILMTVLLIVTTRRRRRSFRAQVTTNTYECPEKV